MSDTTQGFALELVLVQGPINNDNANFHKVQVRYENVITFNDPSFLQK